MLTHLYSPLADFFISGVLLLGIADTHNGSCNTCVKEAGGIETAGLLEHL